MQPFIMFRHKISRKFQHGLSISIQAFVSPDIQSITASELSDLRLSINKIIQPYITMGQVYCQFFRRRIIDFIFHIFNIFRRKTIEEIGIQVNGQFPSCPRHGDVQLPGSFVGGQTEVVQHQKNMIELFAFYLVDRRNEYSLSVITEEIIQFRLSDKKLQIGLVSSFRIYRFKIPN